MQLLAYEELVDNRQWMRPEDWAEAWGICQVVPGVNVIAVAALTGSRLAGWSGVVASVAGLMAPSIVITVLMTAAFAAIRDLHWIKAAFHGIVFAAAGGSVMVGYRLIRPIFAAARRESTGILAAGVAIVAVAGLLALPQRVPLVAVLVGAGAFSAAVLTLAHHATVEMSE